MGASAEDLYELLRAIRMDCSDIQTKITSAFAMLADLNLEDVPHVQCPKCGGKFRGPRTLEEHMHVSHHPTAPDCLLPLVPDWLKRSRSQTRQHANV